MSKYFDDVLKAAFMAGGRFTMTDAGWSGARSDEEFTEREEQAYESWRRKWAGLPEEEPR